MPSFGRAVISEAVEPLKKKEQAAPEVQVTPAVPAAPAAPENPDTPGQPEQPVNPVTPEQPSTPSAPTSKPHKSAKQELQSNARFRIELNDANSKMRSFRLRKDISRDLDVFCVDHDIDKGTFVNWLLKEYLDKNQDKPIKFKQF